MALRRLGDARWGRLSAAFQTIGEQSRPQLSQRMGKTMLRLIREQITQQHDPYGNPYPPRTDGQAALTGLANAFTASFTGNGPVVGTSKWYAKIHQRGWKISAKNQPNMRFRLPGGQWVSTQEVTIPRRQIVPAQATGGLGQSWGDALNKDFNEFMRDYLRGR